MSEEQAEVGEMIELVGRSTPGPKSPRQPLAPETPTPVQNQG